MCPLRSLCGMTCALRSFAAERSRDLVPFDWICVCSCMFQATGIDDKGGDSKSIVPAAN